VAEDLALRGMDDVVAAGSLEHDEVEWDNEPDDCPFGNVDVSLRFSIEVGSNVGERPGFFGSDLGSSFLLRAAAALAGGPDQARNGQQSNGNGKPPKEELVVAQVKLIEIALPSVLMLFLRVLFRLMFLLDHLLDPASLVAAAMIILVIPAMLHLRKVEVAMVHEFAERVVAARGEEPC